MRNIAITGYRPTVCVDSCHVLDRQTPMQDDRDEDERNKMCDVHDRDADE